MQAAVTETASIRKMQHKGRHEPRAGRQAGELSRRAASSLLLAAAAAHAAGRCLEVCLQLLQLFAQLRLLCKQHGLAGVGGSTAQVLVSNRWKDLPAGAAFLAACTRVDGAPWMALLGRSPRALFQLPAAQGPHAPQCATQPAVIVPGTGAAPPVPAPPAAAHRHTQPAQPPTPFLQFPALQAPHLHVCPLHHLQRRPRHVPLLLRLHPLRQLLRSHLQLRQGGQAAAAASPACIGRR